MTKAVQRRRGTASEHQTFTGLEGEITVNTTNDSVHVHDGSTAADSSWHALTGRTWTGLVLQGIWGLGHLTQKNALRLQVVTVTSVFMVVLAFRQLY